jgi:hypothetical protein
MNIIIFVHTCKIYEESRSKIIEDTWAKNRDNVVFITDNNDSTLKNHIYIGEYKKGPTYHPENVRKMFYLFLSKYSDYDFFMIIDDDSYLYVEKLELYLSFFDKNDNYMIGDFLNWPVFNDPNYTLVYNNWVSGGPGIVFTKTCIKTFYDLMYRIKPIYINHDVWLHYLFMNSDKKIKRVDCPGFHQYNSKNLLNQFSKESNHLISVHLEHNLELMYLYHN